MTEDVLFCGGPWNGRIHPVPLGRHTHTVIESEYCVGLSPGDTKPVPIWETTYVIADYRFCWYTGPTVTGEVLGRFAVEQGKWPPGSGVPSGVPVRVVATPIECPSFLEDFAGWWRWKCWFLAGRIDPVAIRDRHEYTRALRRLQALLDQKGIVYDESVLGVLDWSWYERRYGKIDKIRSQSPYSKG